MLGAERRSSLQHILQHHDAAQFQSMFLSLFLQSSNISGVVPRWWFHWMVWAGFLEEDAVTKDLRAGMSLIFNSDSWSVLCVYVFLLGGDVTEGRMFVEWLSPSTCYTFRC